MDPIATILIPTHDHGPTLRASVASALRQTVPVEVFVVGDGVTEETRQIASELSAADARVRFFDHPKGPRHGEIYRHEALEHALGRIVCYLSDDDLYLPRHVEEMSRLLEDADFVHAVAVQVRPEGSIFVWTVDLAVDAYRQELLQGRNRVPLSAGAHTLGIYRLLAEGWTPAPPGLPTDLHMWQKFLRYPGCRFRAGETPTVLVFPSPERERLDADARAGELQRFLERMSGEKGVAELDRQVAAEKIREAAELEGDRLSAIHRGIAWRQASELQVFFPNRDGYSERDSRRFPVRFETWRKIVLTFPLFDAGVPVRIDPSDVPCLIELEGIQLSGPDGRVLWQLTEENSREVKIIGTAVLIRRGHAIRILSEGDDPQVLLPLVPAAAGQEGVHLTLTVRLDTDLRNLTKSIRDAGGPRAG